MPCTYVLRQPPQNSSYLQEIRKKYVSTFIQTKISTNSRVLRPSSVHLLRREWKVYVRTDRNVFWADIQHLQIRYHVLLSKHATGERAPALPGAPLRISYIRISPVVMTLHLIVMTFHLRARVSVYSRLSTPRSSSFFLSLSLSSRD